jgi:hypothetical protein
MLEEDQFMPEQRVLALPVWGLRQIDLETDPT